MTDNLGLWVGFSKVAGIGPARLRMLLDYYGHIEAAWNANPGELRAIGLDRRSVENLVKVRHRIDLEAELKKLEKLGIPHHYAGRIKAGHNWGTGWEGPGMNATIVDMETNSGTHSREMVDKMKSFLSNI